MKKEIPNNNSLNFRQSNNLLEQKSRILILDEKGRVLLVRPTNSSGWTFVGGRLEPDETPEDAISRELKEEIGVELDHLINLNSSYTLLYQDYPSEKIQETIYMGQEIHLFYTNLSNNCKFKLQQSEISDYFWSEPDLVCHLLSKITRIQLYLKAIEILKITPP